MSQVLLFATVLLASVGMDMLFARWTQSVVGGRRAWARLWTGLYYSLSMAVVVVLVSDARLMIPASVLGHMIGTYLAVKPCKSCW
jgi:hypothetical protein